ncbi:MAG TPA: GNAT family N-acetyltransferase [Polyangiaceae bacterium]|jgi:GNAT superfamily N-acetyltransferase|nr:GNAT family N-acetyltransferase [Polyangiaceae bacterium]
MQASHQDQELDDGLDRFDFGRCHTWLTAAYWSVGISRAEVERGFRNSTLVVGTYQGGEQTGCLRVISDRTRFAYFMDVFVDPAARGRGLGRAMVRFALEHPDLAPVYRWLLATHDAHGVYRALGFIELEHPEYLLGLDRPRAWL